MSVVCAPSVARSFAFNLVTDLILVVDIVLTSVTGYYTEFGELVMDASMIRQNYYRFPKASVVCWP